MILAEGPGLMVGPLLLTARISLAKKQNGSHCIETSMLIADASRRLFDMVKSILVNVCNLMKGKRWTIRSKTR